MSLRKKGQKQSWDSGIDTCSQCSMVISQGQGQVASIGNCSSASSYISNGERQGVEQCPVTKPKRSILGHCRQNIFAKPGSSHKGALGKPTGRASLAEAGNQMDITIALGDVEQTPEPVGCCAPSRVATAFWTSSDTPSPSNGVCVRVTPESEGRGPFPPANAHQAGSNPGPPARLSPHPAAPGKVGVRASIGPKGPSFTFGGPAAPGGFKWLFGSNRGATQSKEEKPRARGKVRGALFTSRWGREKGRGCEMLGIAGQERTPPTPPLEELKQLGGEDARSFGHVGGRHSTGPGGRVQPPNTATEGGTFGAWGVTEMDDDCTSEKRGLTREPQSPSAETNQRGGGAGALGQAAFGHTALGGEGAKSFRQAAANPFASSGTPQTPRITDPFAGRDSGSAAIAEGVVSGMGVGAEALENMEQRSVGTERGSVLPVQGHRGCRTPTRRKTGASGQSDEDMDTTLGDGVSSAKKAKQTHISLEVLRDVFSHIDSSTDPRASIRLTLKDYSDIQLRRVTEFYRPRIEQAIEECVEGISLAIFRELKLNGQVYTEIQQLARDGCNQLASKRLLDTVMESGLRAGRAMWETFVMMQITKPKLRKIMREIESKGASLPLEVSRSLMEPRVSNYLKEIQVQHRKILREKNGSLKVNVIGGKTLKFSLEKRYTEPVIIHTHPDQSLSGQLRTVRGRKREEGQRKVIKVEHETVRISQLFRSSFGKNSQSGTAVVSGPAGIGKSTMVQKLVHDWAAGKIYPQFQFVFLFKFRDLNSIKGRTSIKQLILDSYPYFGTEIERLWEEPQGLLFIWDSLEEFKEKIDFTDWKRNNLNEHQCFHPECQCEVSDIVRCLIQQKVLGGCSVLVTTRPTELGSLREAEINLWAEIVGFLTEQRREYFKKYFTDQRLAEEALTYVEQHDILYSMCDNPSYCRVIADSLAPRLRQMQGRQETLPTTITQLFASYIMNIFTNHEFNIYKHHDVSAEQARELLLRTGEMAYLGICHNITVFNENHLTYCRLERSQALPGYVTEQLNPDTSESFFSFIHITVREFVAALAKYLTVDPQGLTQLLDSAGSDDRFRTWLRFIVGLTSAASAQILAECLGPLPDQTTRRVIDWVKGRTESNLKNTHTVLGKRKLLESLYYLSESQHKGLMRLTVGLGETLTLGDDFPYSAIRLMPVDCIVLATVIDPCDGLLELNLNHCGLGPEGIQRLAPTLHKCKVLRLRGNNLTDKGVKLLSAILRRADCKIQTLDLCSNGISHTDGQHLAKGLEGNSSLTQLYLSKNTLGDTGVKDLCVALNSPHCKIQTLELCDNLIRGRVVDQLTSILSHNRSLTCLKLNNNKLGELRLKLLSATLSQQGCPIHTLELEGNGITDTDTEELTVTPIANTSLAKLNLSNNMLTDRSIRALHYLVASHTCLGEIRLQRNKFSSDGASYLQSLSNQRAGLCVEVYTTMVSK
uniref:NACHT, LRR and PYD domains-containing protein 3-like n=1 Tax=Pristiophorus japonicus TaxID=55135 RepID=UPI00398ED40E